MSNNKYKREKFLKVVKQNLIAEETGEIEREESPVSYSKIEEDELMVFAQRFVKANGRFVYCEDEKDFIAKLKSLIDYRKWEKILAFNEDLNSYLNSVGIETVLENKNAIVGISLCQSLLANSGSILITSNQGFGDKINKLPSIFIVVAHSSQVYSNYKEALEPLLENIPQSITTFVPSEALKQSVVEFYLYVIEQ
ncbi:MAG: LUD domain-containing protein [Bacteroidales bacterium]|nr:LUD domain-containing protein [Bacteroidales bacterium]